MIEPLPADNGCSTTLKMVETPVPYGGDSLGSTVMALAGTANGTVFPCVIGEQIGQQYAVVPVQFVGGWPSVPLFANDQIQIGYQGYWYNVAPPSGTVLVLGPNVTLNSFNPSTTGPNAGARAHDDQLAGRAIRHLVSSFIWTCRTAISRRLIRRA